MRGAHAAHVAAFDHVDQVFGHVLGVIAGALEIGDGLDHGRNQAQIPGRGAIVFSSS